MATVFTGCVVGAGWSLISRGRKVRGALYNRDDVSDWEKKIWTGQSGFVNATIAVNVAIFVGWRYAMSRGRTAWMKNHFMSGIGRPVHCLLTSAFSHVSLTHLGFNMFALYSMHGLESRMGSGIFAITYLGAAVVTGFGSLLYHMLTRSMIPSVGASGAILTLFSLIALLNPHSRFGIPFVPAEVFSFTGQTFVYVIGGVSVAGILSRGRFLPLLDHAGHLSAVLLGWGTPQLYMKLKDSFGKKQ